MLAVMTEAQSVPVPKLMAPTPNLSTALIMQNARKGHQSLISRTVLDADRPLAGCLEPFFPLKSHGEVKMLWMTPRIDRSQGQLRSFYVSLRPRRTKDENDRFLWVTLKTCTVNCRDLQGVEHSVSVTAETLFAAVAKALAVFRTEGWVEEIGKGMTSLRITVTNPTFTHEVRMQEFENWLERSSGRPAEMVLRNKMRALLK
jgi:hypothetical protein